MCEVYEKLADALDSLANGFPRTKTGSDIRLLKFIYNEDEAELASQLSGQWETADAIAKRLGRIRKEVLSGLFALVRGGKAWMNKKEGLILFRLAPFIVGSYEAQVEHMNNDMAVLVSRYMQDGGMVGIMKPQPALHRVVPTVESSDLEWILPYDNVIEILNNAKSFHVQDCICRKLMDAVDKGCDAPTHNCLSFSNVEMKKRPGDITREEALKIIKEAEDAALVHSVSNVVDGVHYICNCCGCCCGILTGITKWGIENSMARANYEAIVSAKDCIGCEVCIDRCQVAAIEMVDGIAIIDRDKCLGCGLCVTTCATEAIKLAPRPKKEQVTPPASFGDWEKKRLKYRNML